MKRPSLLKISLVANLLLLICLLFLIFQTQIFRVSPVREITPEYEKELVYLAKAALLSEDVPVGALVIYQNEIIGRGFNTVYRDDNISGHAEINAINNAIENIGLDKFLNLDRKKLSILSTFEPCEMCKGAMNHYRLKNVKFIKDKPFSKWIKNHAAGIFYETSKQQLGNVNIQDSLFRLHPRFPGKK